MEQCIPAPDDCACRIDDMIFADVINRFLASLTVEKRSIFLRRYWYCDATADIAARYGLTESKVRVTLHRTRGKLAAYLQERGAAL